MSKRITDADRDRFERLHSVGCICCRLDQILRWPVEIHHLLSGGRRRGHQFTIPLCKWHHRGDSILPKEQAANAWGASLANGSKPFHERYGSDDELLAKVNELINASP